MRKLIYILLIFTATAGYGQQLNFIQADTLTYNQYLRKEWKPLIKSGKEALENNIDYYYLQIRIAYAYFSLGKYRQAIPYYKNALNFNKYDAVANEYLYYCYKFAGRENDALFQSSNLTAAQKKAMEISDSALIHSVSLSYSYLFSDASEIIASIPSGISVFQDGIQKATYSLKAPRIDLVHRVGKRTLAHHTASFISKDEFSYAIINSTDFLSERQPVRQIEYGLGLDIALAEGLILRPGVHFLRTTIPIYTETAYGPGAGRDRTALGYMYINNAAVYAKITKQTRMLDLGVSFLYNNYNTIQTRQTGFHTTLYPGGSLDHYLSIDAYYHRLNSNNAVNGRIFGQALAGIKVFDNLWFEVSGSVGNNFNSFDLRDYIAYNSLEKTGSSFQISGIIPLYKSGINLFLGYRQSRNESYFFPFSDLLNTTNQQIYHTHLITGGIKWKK